MTELAVLIDGMLIARLQSGKGRKLTLDYETAWCESSQGHSLSVSMPHSKQQHPQSAVLPYLWNLLPENPAVLDRWSKQYHVSSSSAYKLLRFVGADVPGAAQLVPLEQLEELQSETQPTIDWLSEEQLANRLQELRADASAVRQPGDIGRMSLPGAQAKTAFYYDTRSDRWGVPEGRTPTTHIVKPCIPGLDGLVENEHFCQELAARLGMPAARSFVLALDETYIVVERYDRIPPGPDKQLARRIHQEDLCQALGLMPGRKYQEDGGPSIAQIIQLFRRCYMADIDIERFLRANILNWLIGGTDAHAKNYSLLIDAGDRLKLAPLYDLSSQLPYPDRIAQRLAMKIGEHYDFSLIDAADWRKLARLCALEEDRVLGLIQEMAKALPDHISAARAKAIRDGLSASIIDPLAQLLNDHAERCLSKITAPRTSGSPRRRRRPSPGH